MNVNVCLLCAHPVMTSIILHTRRPNFNKKSVTHLVYMFQLIFFFRILRSWKARFPHPSISPHEVCTKEFQVLGIGNLVRKWNNVKIHFLGVENSIIPIGITNIHIQIHVSEFLNKLSFFSVLWILSFGEMKWRQNY